MRITVPQSHGALAEKKTYKYDINNVRAEGRKGTHGSSAHICALESPSELEREKDSERETDRFSV